MTRKSQRLKNKEQRASNTSKSLGQNSTLLDILQSDSNEEGDFKVEGKNSTRKKLLLTPPARQDGMELIQQVETSPQSVETANAVVSTPYSTDLKQHVAETSPFVSTTNAAVSLPYTAALMPNVAATSNAGVSLPYTAALMPTVAATSNAGVSLPYTAALMPTVAATSNAGVSLPYTAALMPTVAATSNAGVSLPYTAALMPTVAATSSAGVSLPYTAALMPNVAATSNAAVSLPYAAALMPNVPASLQFVAKSHTDTHTATPSAAMAYNWVPVKSDARVHASAASRYAQSFTACPTNSFVPMPTQTYLPPTTTVTAPCPQGISCVAEPPAVMYSQGMPYTTQPSTGYSASAMPGFWMPATSDIQHGASAAPWQTYAPHLQSTSSLWQPQVTTSLMPTHYLRKLQDLPEFSGVPEQWPMFAVSFRETTDAYKYTNLENQARLQKALKGPARAKVEALLIYPDGVNSVMQTLEFHYGRTNVLVKSQIDKIKAFPTISSHRIRELVNFSNMVTNLTVFLENAGAFNQLMNPTLLDEMIAVLPLEKREEWVKHAHTNLLREPNVRDFSDWLRTAAMYISLATECEDTKADITHKQNKVVKNTYAIDDTSQSERATVKSNNNESPRKQSSCAVCNNHHKTWHCDKFKKLSIQERWKMVKEKKLCFACFGKGHSVSNCTIRKECGINSCKKSHNRLLHENKLENLKNKDTAMKNETAVNAACLTEVKSKTLFKFLPVRLTGPKGSTKIMAFIDEGSKVTLLDDQVAKKIGLKGASDMLTLKWIGGKQSDEWSQRVAVDIGGLDSTDNFGIKNVRTTKNLKLPAQTLGLSDFVDKYAALKELTVYDYKHAVPKLLIGMPHISLVRPLQIADLDEHFTIHVCKLGNMLFGSNEHTEESTVGLININNEAMQEIHQQMADYFALENFGVKPFEPVISEEDKRAENILQETTKRVGERFETGLLWKSDDMEYKPSYDMAMKRLLTVEKKMNNNPEFANWYNSKIKEYISKSYAAKLTPTEASSLPKHAWYLPHFAVCNINKGNKLRLVFDAAAKIDEVSFNSRLSKGPSAYQPQPLIVILHKFRQGKVAVCGDIKEMFHQVQIRKEDRDAQRFLWRNADTSKKPEEYVMTAMIFGSASSPCSAQYVKNVNAMEHSHINTRAVKAIVESHYVDDYVISFDSADDALQVTKDVVTIHKQAGFELRGFVSNLPEITEKLNGVPQESQNHNATDMCYENSTEKVLGLHWSPYEDNLHFIFRFSRIPQSVLDGQRPPTKREVLSLLMAIFDPFGMLANHTITAKIIMQAIWKSNGDWNAVISDLIYHEWYKWYKSLKELENIKIPRCYGNNFTDPAATVDLHIFVDASELAFAAVAYWRICYENEVSVVFVAAKSRGSPIKPISIPRLELQAAVLGVRLKDMIVNSHDIVPKSVYLWSDSKTVINWIMSDCRQYKQFVAHRISEILHSSDPKQWKWVPGTLNPADDATRLQQKQKSDNNRWINGPKFLMESPETWPSMPADIASHIENTEMRASYLFHIIEEPQLIDFKRFSKYYKLVRTMARIFQVYELPKTKYNGQSMSYVYAKGNGEPNKKPRFIPLRAVHIEKGELHICRLVQKEVYGAELRLLLENKTLPRSSHIYSLNPVIDEQGVIRLSGRIENAKCVEIQTKRPIILPPNHPVTLLMLQSYHEKYLHQNQNTICAAVRQKFWVSGLRQQVRKIASKCQKCKIMNAKPEQPLMGQLPKDRLTPYSRPFTYSGVDYFGPMTVSIGRRSEKRWVALFTCLTVRAVHLELARDLSADAMLLCLRNFVNRRGVPKRLRCDNGTNFVGASREQNAEIEEVLTDECAKRRIEWIFNTPANPSAGGIWERMVRSVKQALKVTLVEKAPQVETLVSLLIEAENIINSRPLTHLPLESSAAEVLTPNHFLIGSPNVIQTPPVEPVKCLRKQWAILQQLKQTFWKQWIREYLPELTRRTKWHTVVKPIKVGDIAIICDDNEVRGEWKRGIVEDVLMAPDNQVRTVVVKTTTGLVRRPASKIAVLDISGATE